MLRLLNRSRTSFSANLGSMITCLVIWLQWLHIHATALFKAITMLWMPWKSNVSICWYSEYCDGQCVHLMRSTLTWHGIRVKNQSLKVVQANYEMTIPHSDLLTDFTSHACVLHGIFPQICIEVTQIRVCLLLQGCLSCVEGLGGTSFTCDCKQ